MASLDTTLNLNKFVPKFLQSLFSRNNIFSNSYLLGQQGPIWIPIVNLYELYMTVPELRAVVDRDASMFSNMKIYVRDKNSKKIIENHPVLPLLDNPNCLASQNQWLIEYRQQLLVYGNQFMYRNKVKSKETPMALWNISAFNLQPYLTGKIFDQISIEGIVQYFHFINTLSVGGMTFMEKGMTLPTSEVMFTRINDINNPIIGKSPIASLQWPLSNTKAGYERTNAIYNHGGALGLISPEPGKEGFGPTNLSPEDRKQMEELYTQDYGISPHQRKIVLSNTAVKFQSMVIPSKDLLIIEDRNANLVAICNAYAINPQIFLTNTTYENLRAGIIQTYQDTIIPQAEKFVQSLTPFLGLKPNEELMCSFEHLSILKENKLKGMQAIESIVASLTQAVEGGILDKKQAIKILERELGLGSADF